MRLSQKCVRNTNLIQHRVWFDPCWWIIKIEKSTTLFELTIIQHWTKSKKRDNDDIFLLGDSRIRKTIMKSVSNDVEQSLKSNNRYWIKPRPKSVRKRKNTTETMFVNPDSLDQNTLWFGSWFERCNSPIFSTIIQSQHDLTLTTLTTITTVGI